MALHDILSWKKIFAALEFYLSDVMSSAAFSSKRYQQLKTGAEVISINVREENTIRKCVVNIVRFNSFGTTQ